jgi:hypothetical protein
MASTTRFGALSEGNADPLVKPWEANREVPHEFSGLVMQSMSVPRNQRFGSARVMRDAVLGVMRTCGIPVTPSGELLPTTMGNAGPVPSTQPAATSTKPPIIPPTIATPQITSAPQYGYTNPQMPAPQPGATVGNQFAAQAPRRKGGKALKIVLVLLLLPILLCGGGGLFAYFKLSSYSAPDRKKPDMPERLAGTVSEFPVDSDKKSGAAPTSVVTDNLDPNKKTDSGQKVPPKWYPPGVDRGQLGRNASKSTSAVYKPRGTATSDSSHTGTTTTDQTYVHVLDKLPTAVNAVETLAVSILNAIGGNRSGFSVNSPTGVTYSGSKIRGPQSEVYVLGKVGGDTIIMIYAPDSASMPMADKLATLVGNGNGLLDYPEIQNTLFTLPQRPPNLTLEEMNTTTPAQMGLGDEAFSAGESSGDPQIREVMDKIRALLPERITTARYSDTQRREWDAIVLDYETGWRAWRLWALAKWTVGSMGFQPTTAHGEDAYYGDQDGKRYLFYQRGPYFIIIQGPTGADLSQFQSFADGFQV